MNFLPQDYKLPSGSSENYLKLQDGENRIRILTRPILGWEDWKDNKPIRFQYDQKPIAPIDPLKPIKHFWAFVVFNYATESIQIFNITQAMIKRGIEGLSKDSDWGLPFHYDIKIHKSGKDKETKYVVNPVPHKPLDSYIKNEFYNKKINLDALFVNGDPFQLGWATYTPLGIDEIEQSTSVNIISKNQSEEIKELFNKCSDAYKTEFTNSLVSMNPSINDFKNIPLELYERMKTALVKKAVENTSQNFPF